MNLPDFKKISIEGVEMKEIYIGDTLIWKGGHTNLLPLTTEADGVTIYNGGLGYKQGYRIRSGGAEGSAGANTFCTGFIPFKFGDVLRMYTPNGFFFSGAENAVNTSDINHTNLGQTAYNGKYGIFNEGGLWSECTTVTNDNRLVTFTLPNVSRIDEVAFIRITMRLGDGVFSEEIQKTIFTVNEEIEL